MTELEKQPFTVHLEELRSRLIKAFIAVTIGFLASYFFKEQIFQILTTPLVKVMKPGDHLIYTNLPEAFFTFLKAAFISGIMIASPYLLYQFWMFVAPGLYDKEKRLVLPILALSTLFFVGGALFGYFVVFPIGFEFFLSFASETIRPMPSMKAYLGFSSKLLLAFGVAFELPLVLTFLARLGIVSVDLLKRYRKYAILLFFVGSALLTPPDVVTQVFMAVPMMLLYELSIFGARMFGKEKKKEDALESEEDTPEEEMTEEELAEKQAKKDGPEATSSDEDG
jgi:sec-independent protein translocase protein TatC